MRWLRRIGDSPAGLKMAWHGAIVLLYVGALLFHAEATRRYYRELP